MLHEEIDVKKYTVPLELSKIHRAAHFLDWCAVERPGKYVSPAKLAQAINGLNRTPRLDNADVLWIQRNMSRVRVVLREQFDRALDSQRGVGVRATTDDFDKLKTDLPKQSKRFISARSALQKSVNMIDVHTIPVTPETKPYLNWLNKSVREVVKLVGTDDFERKLLPPGNTNGDSTK